MLHYEALIRANLKGGRMCHRDRSGLLIHHHK